MKIRLGVTTFRELLLKGRAKKWPWMEIAQWDEASECYERPTGSIVQENASPTASTPRSVGGAGGLVLPPPPLTPLRTQEPWCQGCMQGVWVWKAVKPKTYTAAGLLEEAGESAAAVDSDACRLASGEAQLRRPPRPHTGGGGHVQ